MEIFRSQVGIHTLAEGRFKRAQWVWAVPISRVLQIPEIRAALLNASCSTEDIAQAKAAIDDSFFWQILSIVESMSTNTRRMVVKKPKDSPEVTDAETFVKTLVKHDKLLDNMQALAVTRERLREAKRQAEAEQCNQLLLLLACLAANDQDYANVAIVTLKNGSTALQTPASSVTELEIHAARIDQQAPAFQVRRNATHYPQGRHLLSTSIAECGDGTDAYDSVDQQLYDNMGMAYFRTQEEAELCLGKLLNPRVEKLNTLHKEQLKSHFLSLREDPSQRSLYIAQPLKLSSDDPMQIVQYLEQEYSDLLVLPLDTQGDTSGSKIYNLVKNSIAVIDEETNKRP